MPSTATPDKRPATAPATDRRDADGRMPAGAHLERRQQRNAELTEKAQRDPGGPHTDQPDPANP